ncbi:MAG: AmmeMemoRadiSam system radical SAM enzyme [Candidatus Heimdallarchaeota archaeon]|nr:AmmeMemoRadiSam system radical SAM enzyme [Candidatus Heimdallarchaeota archaeon]
MYRPVINSNRIQCLACAHLCKIQDGKRGICYVRYNENGKLKVPFGYVGAFQCDPIEKKPFFHAYPNSLALSIGMLGCDLKCSYCQNWVTSQTIRDTNAGVQPRDISISTIIETAKNLNARSIVSTYNEPLITSEWSKKIFKEAKQHNLVTGFVSNGNATKEVLDYLHPYLEMYKVDLKTFNDRNYRKLGTTLDKILNGIEMIYNKGIWLEIVTLLIPGFNNSINELKEMSKWIANLSVDIPWHITAYHPDYKMNEFPRTSVEHLLEAANIGNKAGLNYIYIGNVHGQIKGFENTSCPQCDSILVERNGFKVINYNITEENKCPSCGLLIPGRWEKPNTRERLFYFLT